VYASLRGPEKGLEEAREGMAEKILMKKNSYELLET
jgi:hypothetical protein